MASNTNDNDANGVPNGMNTASVSDASSAESKPEMSKPEQSRSEKRDLAHSTPKRKAKRTKHDLKFDLAPPKYSFVQGFRFVAPYVYEYRNFAKQRWLHEPLCSLFQSEFGAYPPEYYEFAIRSGRIMVNGALSDPKYIVQNGDFIVHRTHRHEPPVTDEEIQFVYEDEEVLVVCKPSSMPTHPCGAYRHNSLHSIVAFMRPDLPNLHIVHRLDRLTSGVVIFAKTPAKARQLATCIADREASKTYLARVRGDLSALALPNSEALQNQLLETARTCCEVATIAFDSDGSMRIDCPLRCISHKEGVWECHQEGKESATHVRFLQKLDDETSLVECKPITGRTHQIRLHLQLIGFPIANDPCYGGSLHYGQPRMESSTSQQVPSPPRDDSRDQVLLLPQQPDEDEESFMKRTCEWCHQGEATAFKELQLHCTHIWLHALEYKLEGHLFRTAMPKWAQPSTSSSSSSSNLVKHLLQ